MDIKLREGELILKEGEIVCPVCKGAGYTEKNTYVCEKCDGIGKVDWVANAMTREKKDLDKLNVRRIFIHLNSIVNNSCFASLDDNTINTLKGAVKDHLSSLESRKAS
jgi:RecJ-like exonuclease